MASERCAVLMMSSAPCLRRCAVASLSLIRLADQSASGRVEQFGRLVVAEHSAGRHRSAIVVI
jgi:hypothetical protein